MIALRDYQAEALTALRAAYGRGRRAPILVSPTGSGKSRMGAAVAELTIARSNRVLVLAPRLEILDQLVREIVAAGIPVRTIQAERDHGPADAPVTVASIWTLATPRWRAQLPPADLIIVDECHRALAERSYREVLSAYPLARVLGLTATPARSDGRALGEAFDEIVVATTTAELTTRGFLVPCRVLVPSGDGETLALPVAAAYTQHCAGRLAIAFAANVPHARSITAELEAAGISTALVTGKTPDAARAATMARFSSGEIRVLVNVACFVEGLDVPACSAVIFARKFGHVGPYLQAIGRVLRPAPGKSDAVAVDLLGSALDHGPPDLAREYSLTGTGIRGPAIRDAIRQCPGCGSIAAAGPRICPFCGAEYPARPARALRSDGRGLVDLGDAPRLPPRTWWVSMEAKRGDHCSKCGRWFPPGAAILWAKGQRPKHQRCPLPALPSAEAT